MAVGTSIRQRNRSAPGVALRCARWLVWLLASLPLLVAAQELPPQAAPTIAPSTLEVFVREGCPHCADAKAYLAGWEKTHAFPRIRYRPVDTDPAARDELIRISRRAGIWPPGVPTFVYRGQVLVGFDDGNVFETELRTLLGRAATAPFDSRRAPATAGTSAAIDAGWLGTIALADLGLPLFTLAVGLLDGFNPCAMWVLLFLLALLVRLQDRRRMALIAGTFVLVSGAVYYAFMAAWLNLFLAVGLSTALRISLASLALLIAAVNIKDFVAGPGGLSLSIPAGARPGIYARVRGIVQARSLPLALAGVVALAVVVNFVELLCTAGLPAMYTAVLAQQNLGTAAHYGYLLLYIAGYILDDSIMVGAAVLALGSRKLSEGAGRGLKLLSGVAMLALGLVMLVRPEWLV